MARIGVAGFRHASNRFTDTRSVLDDFERGGGWPPLVRGEAMPAALAGRDIAAGALLDALPALGHEPVPLLWAAAVPSGIVCRDAFDHVLGLLIEEAEARGPLDAVCLDLFGGMLVEGGVDGEAELVARLRCALGEHLPVAVMLDRRANPSPALIEAATLAFGTEGGAADAGVRCAGAVDRMLRAEVRGFATARRHVPVSLRFDCGSAALDGVARRLRRLEMEQFCGLGFAAGFPFAAGAHAGPALFGWGTDPAGLAAVLDRGVDEISACLAGLAPPEPALDPDAAVRLALAAIGQGGRAALLDLQDDPAGGGTGDTTGLLRALVRHGATGACLGLFQDPHVGTVASWAGIGADIHVSLGGKHGIPGDLSIEGSFRVEAMVDAAVACRGRFYAGAPVDLSPLVRLGFGGVQIVVVPRTVVAPDRCLFAALGVDVDAVPLLALKCGPAAAADLLVPGRAVVPVKAPGATPLDATAGSADGRP